MQYLLTKEEYDALVSKGRELSLEASAKLQGACTLAARFVPVKLSWRPDEAPKPWGCILDEGNSPGYCDECPVSGACPNPHKEWSK